MPTDFHGPSPPSFTSFGRSIFSMKRDSVVHSIDNHAHEASSQDQELEAFQRQVTKRLHDLSSVESRQLLSISWLLKLLDAFLCCQEEFRAILFNNKSVMAKQPMDRLVSDYFERSVKGLDVCNAIRDGIEQIRQWQKQLEIVLCALDSQKSLGEGQFRRAKKALVDLAIGMLDEKESSTSFAHRNLSFGRNQKDSTKSSKIFRSLSWSVSRSWSAVKQLQAIGNNIIPPKMNEIIATNGLVVAVYTMSYVLLFVTWALVAAIPCQDRGLQTYFNIPRNFVWGVPIMALHERILEESKKRDKRNSCGLLKEIQMVERCARYMHELTDSVQFPLGDEKEREVRKRVEEVGVVYGAIKNGLDPLEKQVREVFHGIVRSRTEGLDFIARGSN